MFKFNKQLTALVLVTTTAIGGTMLSIAKTSGQTQGKFTLSSWVSPLKSSSQPLAVKKENRTTSVHDALAAGCESNKAIEDYMHALSTFEQPMPEYGANVYAHAGTITKQQIEKQKDRYFGKGWMTKERVTDPNTWVYRGLGIPGEIKSLQSGFLISKATKNLDKATSNNHDPYPLDAYTNFWNVNGPDIQRAGGATSKVADALRILATDSSDRPKSQFVSVALDKKTAESFATGIIVAFQVTPNSPILGLRNCGKTGEVQFQIAGGTRIHNLYRLDTSKRDRVWEKWDAGKKKWIKEKTSPPVHDEL